MRKLSANTFASLDGIMQAPGGPGEDETGDFALGGWSVTYWDDMMGQFMGTVMGSPFDLVLGRRTYDIFAAHWPRSTEPEAVPLNRATKYVASRSRIDLPWGPAELLEGDVAEQLAEIKRGDGPELQVHGSANLLQTLHRAGLVDEYRVWTFPVVLGTGKRLFEGGAAPLGLSLVDSRVSSTGVVIATYRPAGEIKIGSFALD